MESKHTQARVILWALPRSISTAFLTCMSGVPDSKMFYEPYTSAFLFGPDRPYDDAPRPANQGGGSAPAGVAAETASCRLLSGYDDSTCSYDWVKTQLEASFERKQLVFCKDISYCLDKRYQYLPKGYKYIFLIRNPAKVIPSWKKLISDFTGKKENEFTLDELKPPVMPTGVGYGELLELYEYVKLQQIDPDPIIIDADDLLDNPASVLSSCCQKTGIPYTTELLTWQGGDEVVDTWIVSKNLKTTIRNLESFDNVKKSSGFRKTNENPRSADVQPDVQKFIDICMPIYSKLHELRM